jgi:hypothetical protein
MTLRFTRETKPGRRGGITTWRAHVDDRLIGEWRLTGGWVRDVTLQPFIYLAEWREACRAAARRIG